MRVLDLFCGAGGSAMGIRRVFPTAHIVGVDKNHQPRYPFFFRMADAVTFPTSSFDFIWASPPCQRFSSATRAEFRGNHPNLIEPIRAKLRRSGLPYVIENVVGAPLQDPFLLCGAMFGLGVIRHRLFETSFPVKAPPCPGHGGGLVTGEYVTVAGGGGVPTWTRKARKRLGLPMHVPGEMQIGTWRKAMGIDWMIRRELVQAIPPDYSEWILKQWKKGKRWES